AAYQLDRSHAPAWAANTRFDIEARVQDAPESVPRDVQGQLLRALLADRFKLQSHWETREESVLALVMAKADVSLGPGLRHFGGAYDCDAVIRGYNTGNVNFPPEADRSRPVCAASLGQGYWRGGGVTVANLASYLSGPYGVSTRVVDQTGLTGRFDFDLHYN